MSPEQLDELERIARAATPGPWFHRQAGMVSARGEAYDWISDKEDRAPNHKIIVSRDSLHGGTPDYAFIATFNPETVLALLSLLRGEGQRREGFRPEPAQRRRVSTAGGRDLSTKDDASHT